MNDNKIGTLKIVNKTRSNAVIELFGTILPDDVKEFYGSGVSAKSFDKALKDLGKVSNITLRVNSEGGSVIEAKAIFTMLVKNSAKINVEIEGIAASAATVVAMAGDTVSMGEHDFFMIHEARAPSFRDRTADEYEKDIVQLLRKVDSSIVDVYQKRTGVTRSKIEKWMKAETWFTGKEALKNGFVDSIDETREQVAACLTGTVDFKHIPKSLRNTKPRLAALKARHNLNF